jgi:hypothetical protein
MGKFYGFVDGFALSALALGVSLMGCGGSADAATGTPQTPVIAGSPAVTTGTAGKPAVVTTPIGTVAGTGATLPLPVAGTTAIKPVTGGTTGAIAGGGAAGAAGGPAGAAGSAAGSAGAAGAAPADGSWTPERGLDANGVLQAPTADAGFQIATTTFDLQPGQEVYKCFHVDVPSTTTFPVGEWDGQMTAGSHHFILYRSDSDTVASGTLSDNGCTQGFGGNTWLYTQGSPRSHLTFPDAVAMELNAKERLNFDMHYINTGTSVIHAHVILNVNKVKITPYQKADAEISFNYGIAVPPHGTQTVEGDCPPVMGASYFVVQTHTHKFATQAKVSRTLANGMPGEDLVVTTNWDNPQAHIWPAAPFLTFQAGELMHYSCDYKNDTDATVTVGTSAATNEMCMAEAYYFPASATTPTCY